MKRLSITIMIMIGCLSIPVFRSIPAEEVKSPMRIAVFKEDLPGADAGVADALKNKMEEAGFTADFITAGQASDSIEFSRQFYDLLMIPESRTFPMEAFGNIDAFLKQGGHLVTLGGPPFSNPCFRDHKGRFIDKARLLKIRGETKPKKMLLDFEGKRDMSSWKRDVDPVSKPSTASIVKEGADKSKSCLRADYPDFKAWDTFGIPMDNPFPKGFSLTCFWAKGMEQTTMLCVEWEEADHSRWIASVKLSPQWTYYVLTPYDFKYWHASAPGTKRGGVGDRIHPENAILFKLGLALSHTFIPQGRHGFWFDQLGVAPDVLDIPIEDFTPPVWETISPEYKYYPLTNIKDIKVSPLLEGIKFSDEKKWSGISPAWRPQGTGFEKNRKRRFIPLLKVYDSYGLWCGTLASMVLNTDGDYRGSIFATVTFDSPGIYREPEIQDLIVGICKLIQRRIFLTEGGSEFFAYFHDDTEVRLGARVMNLSKKIADLEIHFQVRDKNAGYTVFEETRPMLFDPNQEKYIKTAWKARVHPLPSILPNSKVNYSYPTRKDPLFAMDQYLVKTELFQKGIKEPIDILEHEMNVWFPREKNNFVHAKKGHFYFPGSEKPWIPFGVNYMPTTGIAFEENESFEHWMDPHTYDPEMIEADLTRIEKILKMNMVSIFSYSGRIYSGNLLDILCRCRRHNLMVHYSLRPFADPLKFRIETVEQVIREYRLAENDTIFAYDIAWEPWFGHYQIRRQWDKNWKEWIETNYGTEADSENDWGFPVPRDEWGNATSPSDVQVSSDGEWRIMVAAYRRFVDDFLTKKYCYAIRKIKEIDPNHLVSFRMSEAGNPKCFQSNYPFDVRSIAKAVDFFEPEGYGRFGPLWDNTKTGIFTTMYLRSLAEKPVFWGEFGQSVWMESNFNPNPILMESERMGYHNFLQMILESRSDGGSAWWFPGGYRWNENSDFGMLNPDGSPRPLQEAIDKYQPLLANPVWIKDKLIFKPDAWITVDRDKHANGIYGMYAEIEEEFWKAWDAGKTVGIKTEGFEPTPDMPLMAVGNTAFTGKNPPKYLNGQFNYLRVRNKDGNWAEMENRGEVRVEKNKAVDLEMSLGNTGDAIWIAPKDDIPNNIGTVSISSLPESGINLEWGLSEHTLRFGDAIMVVQIPPDKIQSRTKIILRFQARRRTWIGEKILQARQGAWFGEKMEFTLNPE